MVNLARDLYNFEAERFEKKAKKQARWVWLYGTLLVLNAAVAIFQLTAGRFPFNFLVAALLVWCIYINRDTVASQKRTAENYRESARLAAEL